MNLTILVIVDIAFKAITGVNFPQVYIMLKIVKARTSIWLLVDASTLFRVTTEL